MAFCSDIGISPTHSATMLSVMLAAAFLARQAWGALADRIGGLRTVLAGSACQAVAITGFLLTQDEAGLFAISAAFGLGFAGIIPAYSVAVRDLFPSSEASWRMPLTLFTAMSGMAVGSWFAGLLYDHFGYYVPAFVTGVAFNVAQPGDRRLSGRPPRPAAFADLMIPSAEVLAAPPRKSTASRRWPDRRGSRAAAARRGAPRTPARTPLSNSG